MIENKIFKKKNLGYIEGTISIFVNIFLFILKYWAGIVSSSVALIADAWHTLSDSISSIVLIAGIKMSRKEPDIAHAFGHGRWEQISAIFIGFLLGTIGFEFLRESIAKFSSGESARFGTIAVVVTIVSILVKEGLAQFAFFISRKTDSISVKADGWHHRTDALSSLIVLLGIFLRDSFWWIDSLLGAIISFMIFLAAYRIVRDAINKLLGEIPSGELVRAIEDIIKESEPEASVPHHFHIHNYGEHRELTFHLKFNKNTNIEKGHMIATRIEKIIKERLNIETTIHIEPVNVKIMIDS